MKPNILLLLPLFGLGLKYSVQGGSIARNDDLKL
jgi:hypothetical protein